MTDPNCPRCCGTGRAPIPHSDEATEACGCVDWHLLAAEAAKRTSEALVEDGTYFTVRVDGKRFELVGLDPWWVSVPANNK